MKPVQNAMQYGCKNKSCCNYEDQTGIKSITSRKKLSGSCDRHIDGSHATEKHCCIKKSIYHCKMLKDYITYHSKNKGSNDQAKGSSHMYQHPFQELNTGKRRMFFGFIHVMNVKVKTQIRSNIVDFNFKLLI